MNEIKRILKQKIQHKILIEIVHRCWLLTARQKNETHLNDLMRRKWAVRMVSRAVQRDFPRHGCASFPISQSSYCIFPGNNLKTNLFEDQGNFDFLIHSILFTGTRATASLCLIRCLVSFFWIFCCIQILKKLRKDWAVGFGLFRTR